MDGEPLADKLADTVPDNRNGADYDFRQGPDRVGWSRPNLRRPSADCVAGSFMGRLFRGEAQRVAVSEGFSIGAGTAEISLRAKETVLRGCS